MSRLFPGFETSDRVFACDGCTTWLYDAMTYDLILWAWVPVWMDCADMINVIVTMTFFYMLVTSYIWFLYYTWLNVTFCYCWSSFALCCLFLHILYYCCPRVVSLSGKLHTSDVADPLVGTFIVLTQVRVQSMRDRVSRMSGRVRIVDHLEDRITSCRVRQDLYIHIELYVGKCNKVVK